MRNETVTKEDGVAGDNDLFHLNEVIEESWRQSTLIFHTMFI